jgi:hypothetical protein
MKRRSLSRLVWTAAALLAATADPARADWVASGVFTYMDREFDGTGFTGVQQPMPIREADVEVVDAGLSGNRAILATGVTGQNGSFSILVPDTKPRNIYVRVITDSLYTESLNIDVRNSTSSQAQKYALATATVPNHAPTSNVNFGTLVAGIGQGGEAFNLYDQLVRGVDYLAFLTGSRPGSASHLVVVWDLNNGVPDSTYNIGSRMILMRSTGGYDDTVVLHEMGHYAVYTWSASSSIGGFHTFAACQIDVRLAFDEGFATWWGNSVLRHHGLPRSNVYTRTNGGPGPGNLVRSADLETDTQYLCRGAASEVNVFSFLWDIADGPATPDTTPGTDDAHDLLAMPDSEIWSVMTGYFRSASSRSLEDFWDGWFLPPALNGSRADMIDLADPLGIEYFEDASEANDTAPQAFSIPVNGSPTPACFFRDPDGDGAGAADLDFFVFPAIAGTQYAIETRSLAGGANTYLRLYGPDGATLLAVNDDRGAGDLSSRVLWTPSQSGILHAQVSQASLSAVYGSYQVLVTAAGLDADGDGWDSLSDCNDQNVLVHPGAVEICDGEDQDCDGLADEGFDLDGDGFTFCEGDCNDNNASINPGAGEVPGNGVDENCDGRVANVLEGSGTSPRVEIPQ